MNNLHKILTMPYVDFMAYVVETNRAPGGEKMLIEMARNTFLNQNKNILHIACNTGSALRALHRRTGCTGTGIDINENMANTANKLRDREGLTNLLQYHTMDAHKLSFESNIYDLSYTSGGMAFIPDKSKAISEMVRVTKDSGFIADIVMYYKKEPPKYLIPEMNNLMNINIQKRDKKFWIDIYEEQGLKLFHEFEGGYENVSHEKLLNYCRKMSHNNKSLTKEERLLIEYKLFHIFALFTENHKYLGASLLIFRKQSINDQIALF